jgi:hypothetical protein
MAKTLEVGPGDILAVAGGDSIWGKLIRFGEYLMGKLPASGHVVVVTHQDDTGRWLGIEGRPSSVGVCDVTRYLTDRRVRGNHGQPRPNDVGQEATFLASCAKSLGLAYDWVAIAEDTLDAVRLHDLSEQIDVLWRWPAKDGELPGHVVCSSLAAMLYAAVGWAHPDVGSERVCEPADWWQWNDGEGWVV